MNYKSNDIEDVSSKFNRQPYLFKGLIGFGLVSMQNEKFQMKKGFFQNELELSDFDEELLDPLEVRHQPRIRGRGGDLCDA